VKRVLAGNAQVQERTGSQAAIAQDVDDTRHVGDEQPMRPIGRGLEEIDPRARRRIARGRHLHHVFKRYREALAVDGRRGLVRAGGACHRARQHAPTESGPQCDAPHRSWNAPGSSAGGTLYGCRGARGGGR
jgi:hypothetical protein